MTDTVVSAFVGLFIGFWGALLAVYLFLSLPDWWRVFIRWWRPPNHDLFDGIARRERLRTNSSWMRRGRP